MDFKCILTESEPQYAAIDVGSARCRMHPESMRRLRITIGAVLKIEVAHSAPSRDLIDIASPKIIEILCIAWPDSFGVLDESTICMDTSVMNNATLDPRGISSHSKVYDS
jgi:hypothetical protein